MSPAATVLPREARAPVRAYGLLLLAVACVSAGSILIRMADAHALTVSFWRITLAAALVAPFAAPATVRAFPGLTRRQRLALLASGAALAVHFAAWIASLSYTSVAASVLLVNTAPVFTLAFSRVVLGEPASPGTVIATVIALLGAGLIAAGDWSGGAGSLTGAALALIGAVTLSAYHLAGRGLRHALPLLAYVFVVWTTAAAALAAVVAGMGVGVTGLGARAYMLLFALALVPTVLGHGLVNRSLRVFPAPTVGLFLLGEPLAAAGLAYAFLGEVPGPWTVAGGALVLAALAVVVRSGHA